MKKTGLTTIKTVAIAFAIAGAATLSSCGTAGKAVSAADINGEWFITEAGGKTISGNSEGERPFIGFDTNEGRVYGHLGCNRLTGGFDKSMAPGKIDLSKTGSTRMMCPDMTTEDLILNQIGKISGYKILKGDKLALTDDNGASAIILERKNK